MYRNVCGVCCWEIRELSHIDWDGCVRGVPVQSSSFHSHRISILRLAVSAMVFGGYVSNDTVSPWYAIDELAVLALRHKRFEHCGCKMCCGWHWRRLRQRKHDGHGERMRFAERRNCDVGRQCASQVVRYCVCYFK